MKTSNKNKTLFLFFDLLLTIIFVVLDQFTKSAAVTHLKDKPAIILIENVFELHYLENRGAAFGMLQNQKIFFVIISVVMLVVISYVLVKIPHNKHYYVLEIILVLVASGAIGNLIDRVRFGYVVDFFYFKLINFPIFNVADIYVSVSCVLLAILLIFFYKEHDLEFLSFKKKKE